MVHLPEGLTIARRTCSPVLGNVELVLSPLYGYAAALSRRLDC
jgi:hypothetical protein